jgi:hypothetical protein
VGPFNGQVDAGVVGQLFAGAQAATTKHNTKSESFLQSEFAFLLI